ncbi:MAG: DUF3822 family protein [Bacteroidia bacterium]|nr:DUF3822 family protein [Bacteroidia bacterium]
MSTAYHHAISNRLFIALSADELSYVVTDKDLNSLVNGTLAVPDLDVLANVVETNQHLKQIFAQVRLVFQGNDFACAPVVFSQKAQRDMVFRANHKLGKEQQLVEGSLSKEVGVLYAVQQKRLELLKASYPSLVYNHEVELFYQFFQSEYKTQGPCLVLKQQRHDLLMLVLDDKTLQLANRYTVSNLEDVFYYTMLAVEQLEIDIEETRLYWLKNTSFSDFQQVAALFENYIQHLEEVDHEQVPGSLENIMIKCA